MKLLQQFLLVLFLAGCVNLSQFTYDGAGHFTNLMSYRNKSYSYNDAVDEYNFDAVVLIRVEITDRSEDIEQYGSPLAMFRLSDEYLNSTPELKDTLYWRGDFARYYHHRIHADWVTKDNNNRLEGYVIMGVQSGVKEVALTKLRIQFFASSTWLDIPINKTIKIIPNGINYLGTLSVEFTETDDYSGRTIKQAYFQYDTAIVEGNSYNTQWKLHYEAEHFKSDKQMLSEHYPDLSAKYKGKIHVIR